VPAASFFIARPVVPAKKTLPAADKGCVRRKPARWAGKERDLVKKRLYAVAIGICLLMPVAGFCGGDLDVFVSDLNAEARVDLGAFKARVAATFGVPMVQVEAVIGDVRTPGDAYMVFRAGQVAGRPPDVVLAEYRANQGKGWGVIAKNLGIKPGSAEFHALKNGWSKEKGGKGRRGKKDKGKGRG